MELSPELESRLKSISTLPSPPQIAMQVIELAQQADPDLPATAKAISRDPALATKILRVANSPLYARRRRCDNLRQALLVLGLNATLTLALSFSLGGSLRKGGSIRLDCERCWRRSLLSGIACRALSRHLQRSEVEEFFLAALLQDIGMLAIDKAFPEVYECRGGLPSDHQQLAALEIERLGVDHTTVGAWLLQSWQMPAFLRQAVAASHDPGDLDRDDPMHALVCCVALSGQIADMWLTDGGTHRSCEVADMAQAWLGLDRGAVSSLLEAVHEEMGEAASLYETRLLDAGEAEAILEQARDILLVRNLQALHEVSALRATAETLESRAHELEEANRRDTLTGTFNRSYLDERMAEEFRAAREGGWPFSVMFVDLDRFKRVNDTYGHIAGDRLLVSVAGLMRRTTRPTDVVARYGGEEFVVLLPGNNRETALVVAQRLVEAFRSTRHAVGDDLSLGVTASVGVASLDAQTLFETMEQMLDAADKAVYEAKAGGRDRFCILDPEKALSPEAAGA